MTTRQDLRELSQYRFPNKERCAISFYFQPSNPRSRSHREELILAKELAREAMRELAANGNDGCARADIEKVLKLAEDLPLTSSRAKAVFAYGKNGYWREFDLPPQLPGTQLCVRPRFCLKPLAALVGAQPRLGVVVFDRHRARLFDAELDEIHERTNLFHPVSRRGRSEGYSGYDGGHADRQMTEEVQHHYRNLVEELKLQCEDGTWEKLVLGCHDFHAHEFEPCLPPSVSSRIIGHFSADVASVKNEEIRGAASRLLQNSMERRRHELVHQAVSHARGHRKGVTGLRRVLRSLELREVQTLLIGKQFAGHAVECTRCGHMDSHIVRYCSVCGSATSKMDDVSEGIIPAAVRSDAQLVYVDDPELDAAGNIAAILRYRVEGVRSAKLTA